jgi:hypothetical protein
MPDKKKLIYIIIVSLAILVTLLFFGLNFIFWKKEIEIEFPKGLIEIKAGQTYQIIWKSKKIERVGIVLFKGNSPQWIAKDISAGERKYNWEIFVFQEPGQDYKIAIFEYPWKKGNKIVYSDTAFTIIGPKFASCDYLSIRAEWPYVPSDYPNLRKVFITLKKWQGDLGGLEGADKKCQTEAEEKGLGGKWMALLGDDRTSVQERLRIDGVFVDATEAIPLPEKGKVCHRLLGENWEKFLAKFSLPGLVAQEKIKEDFLSLWTNIWLGRLAPSVKQDCLFIGQAYPIKFRPVDYSFTVTCQNWTRAEDIISGYSPYYSPDQIKNGKFPKCYTPEGASIEVVGMGGLASGLTGEPLIENSLTHSQGKYCSTLQRLLCVEQ